MFCHFFAETGGGRRATRMTIAIAVLIWILAIICGLPALIGSYIKVIIRVNVIDLLLVLTM